MEELQPFPYDENYLEYLPCKNYLSIFGDDEFSGEDALTFNWVDRAIIKKVLINLRRFHIDPRQFAAD